MILLSKNEAKMKQKLLLINDAKNFPFTTSFFNKKNDICTFDNIIFNDS